VAAILSEIVAARIEEFKFPALVEGKTDREYETLVCWIVTILVALPARSTNILVGKFPTKLVSTCVIELHLKLKEETFAFIALDRW
jgi:hypothetical protein